MNEDTSVDDADGADDVREDGFEWGVGRDDTGSGTESVDDDVRETVERDLAELAEDDEPEYPSGDDPVTPQSIDAENAAFVVLGVLATVGLVAFLVLSV
ncbi:hypothetical protein G9C85_12395 [Halorubellus sp. JP-L1]|uniref:DUF7312 domain-containing protein n=1 Tax=Halorubellus sp. JP-L1 TaxID=2715753 RepID=UPI001409A89A|nr:hypothetical protein [Halorubellus sp. JP-L1]NHN42419.1 hypothetical protein [Halorubellus sp. JP-L1]